MKYSAAALGAFASWSYAQTSGTDEEEPCAAISQAWAGTMLPSYRLTPWSFSDSF